MYSRPVRVAGLVLVAAVALVAAGCGGERLSQSAFDTKTSSICARYTKLAQKELGPVPGNPLAQDAPSEQLARFGHLLEHVATLFGRQLDELRRVRPPGESSQRYVQVLRLYSRIESALNRGARAARKGDRVGVVRAEEELTALGRQADALGFKCE